MKSKEPQINNSFWQPIRKRFFFQEWENVVFLHYKVEKKALQLHVPKSLELDQYKKNYWVSIIAFDVKHIRPLQWAAVPLISDFHAINIRTYVRCNGKSGIYFLSIKGQKALSCFMARLISGLQYDPAKIRRTNHSFVVKDRTSSLSIKYKMGSQKQEYNALDRWLLDRNAIFINKNNKIYRSDIQHEAWHVKQLNLKQMNVDQPKFYNLLNHPPNRSHYSEGTKVLFGNSVLEISNYS